MVVIFSLLISSCANEKKFVRFHDKNPKEAIGHCLVWNPSIIDSVHEKIVYKPGKPQIIPGETIYADCDSAYQAAYDEAIKLGLKKVVVKKVAVPCPPSTITHDSVFMDRYERIRYMAIEDSLKVGLMKANVATGVANNETAKYKNKARRNFWALIALIVLDSVYVLAKITKKGSIV